MAVDRERTGRVTLPVLFSIWFKVLAVVYWGVDFVGYESGNYILGISFGTSDYRRVPIAIYIWLSSGSSVRAFLRPPYVLLTTTTVVCSINRPRELGVSFAKMNPHVQLYTYRSIMLDSSADMHDKICSMSTPLLIAAVARRFRM